MLPSGVQRVWRQEGRSCPGVQLSACLGKQLVLQGCRVLRLKRTRATLLMGSGLLHSHCHSVCQADWKPANLPANTILLGGAPCMA